ncbi:InlB B-repeat-containing protein [Allobaculum mucilyticum]|uniref:InlB B-repeat-containing protein n=1 Tax=Allobaculum mucilyticum TaxID=2834459 RepID=UPI001E54FD93|nr:InlB B-repeat-containing protein [Allobaculum mucilyticum]UNT96633.1 InlB B-repeat-containing protein [Allobaculum mucilyticum]
MKKHSRILLELLCSGCMALGSVTTAFVPVFAVEETDPGQTADIPEALPDLSKITLTVDSQGESWGTGNRADKAIDGNFDTIFDGLKNSYMVFDLGGEKTIAGIGYCPRTNAGNNNYSARTQGGVIAGSNDKETWTDLYTIPEVPAQNKITQVRSSSFNEGTASSYRYIKYYKNESGNNADADYVNIAEFEVYEPGSHFTLSSVGAIKDNQLHMPATVKANGVNRTVTWTMPEIEGSLPLSAVEVTGILDAQGDLPEAQITGKAWIYPSDLEYLINGNAGENDPLWQQAKTLYPELLNADAADQGWEEGKSWGVVGEKTTSNESNTGDYGVTGNQESLSPYDYGWWAGTKTDDSKVLKIKLTLPAGKHTIKVGTHGNWWNSDSTCGQKAYWILDDGTEYEIGDCSITERNAQAFSFDIDLNTQQTGTLAFKKTGEKEPTIAWVTVSGKYEGVDRSALNTLYDTVKDYAAADFSEESWAGFEDARSAAATALKTPLPTTEGVSTALANLQKETDELRHLYTLVFKNGDEVFKTVENAVEKEPLSTYIPSETPTADGQIFIGWGIAEDEVVSGSRLEFVAQYKGDTTELDNEYKECLQITNDGNTYSQESFDAFTAARDAAKAVLDKEAPSAAEVTEALTALQAARQALVELVTVTFNTQDGSTIELVTVEKNTVVARPAENPTKAGFTFKGWYTTADGDEEFDFDTPITQSTTIYAQWTEIPTPKYTVTFDTQGGTPVESVNVEENGKVTRPANDPQKTGYTFAGWFAEGSEKVFDFSTPITGDLKLKARWTVESYVVTFDSDGGTPVASMTTDYGTAITAPSNPTKTGYTFAGWFVGGAEKAFDFNTKITGPLTLTAHWTANKYTVSFDSDGGSAVSPVTVEFNHPISKPADPTKTGCIFDGWFAEGSKTAFDFSTPITGDLKLVAHWMNRILTVLFVVDGVSDFAIPVINGNSVARPDDPVRKGYRFAGWYADEARETPYDFTTKVTKPIRIYANWEKGPDYTLLDMAATKAVQIERSLQSYRSIIGTDGKDVKTVFAEAKAAAEAVRNSSTATQEDVDNAAKALNNAMLALRKAPSKEVLDQLSA